MTYERLPAVLLGVPGALGRVCAAPSARAVLMDVAVPIFWFMVAGATLLLAVEWLRDFIGGL